MQAVVATFTSRDAAGRAAERLGAAGVAGTAGGAAVGDTLEEILSNGVPRDDLPKYEDALRRGRSLVVALAERDDELSRARELLAAAGAETIDGAPAQ